MLPYHDRSTAAAPLGCDKAVLLCLVVIIRLRYVVSSRFISGDSGPCSCKSMG
jgi:hypothetical protein